MVVFHTCATLMLPGFIRATVHKDYSPLVKEGELTEVEAITEETFKQEWLKINSEYCEIVGNLEIEGYVNRNSRIYELTNRIAVYQGVVGLLRAWHYEPLAEKVRDEFNVALDSEDPEQYAKDLDRVIILLKGDELEIEQLMEDEPEPEESKPTTEKDFEDMLVEMLVAFKVALRPEDLTTMRYASLIKKLKAHYAKPQLQPY